MKRRLLFALPALALVVLIAGDARAEDDHPIVAMIKSKVKDKDK